MIKEFTTFVESTHFANPSFDTALARSLPCIKQECVWVEECDGEEEDSARIPAHWSLQVRCGFVCRRFDGVFGVRGGLIEELHVSIGSPVPLTAAEVWAEAMMDLETSSDPSGLKLLEEGKTLITSISEELRSLQARLDRIDPHTSISAHHCRWLMLEKRSCTTRPAPRRWQRKRPRRSWQ